MDKKNALQSATIWGLLALIGTTAKPAIDVVLNAETDVWAKVAAVVVLLGQVLVLWGRWRKGDLTLGMPTNAGPPALAALICIALLPGCTVTNYNIDFANGAFRVADKMKIEPGQAGDDGSSTASGPTAAGEEGSPGGSNLLRGFAQQGNIFQIGTAAKSDGEARASANVQSPNSSSGTGEEVTSSTQPAPEPAQ